MTCYIVTFDTDTNEARTRITNILKTLNGYCPIHRFCWAVLTDMSAAALRDLIAEGKNPTDRIFVIRSGTQAAWRNSFGTKNNEWLKKNL